MLPPAYGLLKMILETYKSKVCDDIAFVPVSISYDEVPEQSSYSKELRGGQKVKENALALLKSRKIIQKKFGKVYVNIAPVLYAKQVYEQAAHSGLDEKLMLQKTAFRICKSITDVTPITPKSICSTILLTHRISALPLEDILRLSTSLIDYVSHSGFSLSVSDPLDFQRGVEQSIRKLIRTSILNVSDSVPRTFFCENKKRVFLNFYKNNASHCFVNPSIFILSWFHGMKFFLKSGKIKNFLELFQSTALHLRDILKFDFFFNPRNQFVEELKITGTYFFGTEDWQECELTELFEKMAHRFPDANDLSIYLRFLGDLLESYATMGSFLVESSEKSFEKKALLSRLMKYAEAKYTAGEITFPESMSVINYSNALLYFENQGILKIVKTEEKTHYEKSGDLLSLRKFIESLTSFLDLMQENPESFFKY
jgi:glycerol-3-phosphate O-acyltransferase